jgi:hypothetical protein
LNNNTTDEQTDSSVAAVVQMLAERQKIIFIYITSQSLSVNCKSAVKLQTPPGHTSAALIS